MTPDPFPWESVLARVFGPSCDGLDMLIATADHAGAPGSLDALHRARALLGRLLDGKVGLPDPLPASALWVDPEEREEVLRLRVWLLARTRRVVRAFLGTRPTADCPPEVRRVLEQAAACLDHAGAAELQACAPSRPLAGWLH